MNDETWTIHDTQHRTRLSRRETLIGAAFLATAAAGFVLKPRHNENMLGTAKLDDLVPRQIGPWRFNTASGLVLPPADQLRDKIYSQLLTRTYVRDGSSDQSIMLLIAYSGTEDGTVQIHRPEVCYPAGGYRLTRIDPHTVPLAPGVNVPSRAIVAETDVRREQLIYWTRIGQHFPTRWFDEHMAVAAENFHGMIPDGVLVRVSTTAPGNQTPLMNAFARDLFQVVGPRMRQVLLGPSAR